MYSLGFCPQCGAPGKSRERRPNGYDTCDKGHKYLSKDSLLSADQKVAGDALPAEGQKGTISLEELVEKVKSYEQTTGKSVRIFCGRAIWESIQKGENLKVSFPSREVFVSDFLPSDTLFFIGK